MKYIVAIWREGLQIESITFSRKQALADFLKTNTSAVVLPQKECKLLQERYKAAERSQSIVDHHRFLELYDEVCSRYLKTSETS